MESCDEIMDLGGDGRARPHAIGYGGGSSRSAAPVVAKNVVLVHGAWADGSGWGEVIPRLQAAGLHVTAVQNRSTRWRIPLPRRAVCWRWDGPTILVAHSWGGTVISEIGTDPKVSALVYVAARA
jgi:pimeloyl-ACP methyl ester carboxylesterase